MNQHDGHDGRFREPAKKSLGQHFLHERGVVDRIILAVDPRPGDRVVEIGPGQGAMTFPLLDRHGTLTAIEFDRDLLAPLTVRARGHGELELIHANVLDVDFTALAAGTPLRLVGNLPYNLSSPILFHALDHAAAVRDMHFMLQKEVVERLAAEPGGPDWGRLSVMAQYRCRVESLFVVPPEAFVPRPKVDSAIVRLTPHAELPHPARDEALLAAIVKEAFGQRRKTLRNNLKGRITAAELEALDIDPGRRPQTLSVEEFVRIADHLAQTTGEARP